MNKSIIFMLLLFSFSFTSAQVQIYQLDTEINVTVVCLNDGYCSALAYCNINIEDPVGALIVTGQNMTNQGSFHNYTLNVTELGEYSVTGFCNDGTEFKQIDFPFDVTQSGEKPSIITIMAYIFLLLLVLGIMSFMKSGHRNMDFDAAKKRIVEGHKNKGETMVRGIITALFQNSFLWIYFTGWIAVLILREILYQFGGTVVYGYFVLMANVYSLGAILVTAYMIGYLMTYMKNIFSILTDNSWGVGD